MMKRLREWLAFQWAFRPVRCYQCGRWFRRDNFWNPWGPGRLTTGLVQRAFAAGELTAAQAAQATLAAMRGHHGLCCSEECCAASRTRNTKGIG